MKSSLTILLVFLPTALLLGAPLKNPLSLPSPGLEFGLNDKYRCHETLQDPYTDDLLFDSKYDQKDTSKSTKNPKESEDSKYRKQYIRLFSKQLVKQTDLAITTGNNKTRRLNALQCVREMLSGWSKARALLTHQTTKTGMAYRKWFLSTVGTVLMKLHAAYRLSPVPLDVIIWVNELAQAVHKDYSHRLIQSPRLVNNHDYWAAHAIATAAVVTGNDRLTDYVEAVYRFSIRQVISQENLGYFPQEIKRGQLAESYMNFALTPVMFIAEMLLINGIDITDSLPTLKRLARFNVLLNRRDPRVASIIRAEQKIFSRNKFIWALPYLRIFGVNDDVAKQMLAQNMTVNDYVLLGGDLYSFYPYREWKRKSIPGAMAGMRNSPERNIQGSHGERTRE